MVIVTSSFSEVSKCFPTTRKRKAGGFKFLAFEKSQLEKLCFRDGLVWKVGRTVEIKLRFQISLAYCGRGQNLTLAASFVMGLCFLTNKV